MLVLKAIRHHVQNNGDKRSPCLWHQEMQTQVGNGMLLAKCYHTLIQTSNWRGLCLEEAHKSFLKNEKKQTNKEMKMSCAKRTFKSMTSNC